MKYFSDSNHQQLLDAMMVAFKGREEVVPHTTGNLSIVVSYAFICHNEWKQGFAQSPKYHVMIVYIRAMCL